MSTTINENITHQTLFEIADRLNILYQFGDLKYEGCYMFLKESQIHFFEPEPVVPR